MSFSRLTHVVSTGRGKNHIDNSLSECRPFCVVWNTGKNYSFCKPHHIDYSSLRSSDLYQKTLITGLKNGILSNTRNLPGRRVSTSQVDLDQTCYTFTCWKTDVKEGKLTIRNLRPVDSGLYQCVATNSLGTKKATMTLVVTAGLY